MIGKEVIVLGRVGKVVKISFSRRLLKLCYYLIRWEDGSESWHSKHVVSRKVE